VNGVKIGELCERTGASKDTVRHYEKLGLLTPKYLPAGSREYRHYDETAVDRMQHIANGKQAGFSLREIRTANNASQSNATNRCQYRKHASYQALLAITDEAY